jgi:CRISPR-associated endonuclease Cas1
MAATQTLPQYLPDDNSPTLITPRHGVVTLFGYGISACVDRGHLILEDGIGPHRRKARLPRVGHGLRRLVVIGSDGMVSLGALRWLADQDASFVMLDRVGSVLATTGPVRPSDARLRRAQSLAAQSGTDLRITRSLIAAKLAGQERIAREKLDNATAAQAISQARLALDTAATIPATRGLEAKAGHAYWHAWKSLPVSFPKVDVRKIPEHWKVFGTRISPISGSPRCAVNPPNAVLNYLYAILESESRLALAAVGLDPGLGFLHVDSRTRDSLACDLMEPIRPNVDAYVLEWLTHRLFQRKDFFEMADGTCRLMAGLCVQLSQTARTWAHDVAPWAESVARTLWSTVGKPGKQPATPLTGDHRRAGRAGEHTRPVVFPPKPTRVCKTCGVPCEKTYCASCGAAHSREEFDKGRLVAQLPESRARRSTTQKAHVLANQAWKPCAEFVWLDRKTYVSRIQPRLAKVPISVLQSALGISEPYATDIRAGRRVPHARHWLVLAKLAGVDEPS